MINKPLDILFKLLKSVINGIFIGLICALYKYLVEYVLSFSLTLYTSTNIMIKIFAIVGSIFLTIIAFILINKNPHIKGSGLSQIEYYRHKNDFTTYKPIKNIFMMMANTFISFFTGAHVGSEAPNIFIGANVGILSNKITKKEDDDEIGISMGSAFSSAFLSPFAGIAYAFEEGKSKFNLINLIRIILSGFIGYGIMLLINPHPLIPFSNLTPTDDRFYHILPLLGITIALCAILVNKLIKYLATFVKLNHKNFIVKYRLIIYLLIVITLYAINPLLAGSGLFLIKNFNTLNLWYIVLILLIVRIIFQIISNISDVSGGYLLPSLAIGLLFGLLFAEIFSSLIIINESTKLIIVLISMFTFYAVSSNVPFTATLLVFSVAGYENITIMFMPTIITMSFAMLPRLIKAIKK